MCSPKGISDIDLPSMSLPKGVKDAEAATEK